MYTRPEIPGRVLKAMLKYARWLEKPASEESRLDNFDRAAVDALLKEARGKPTLGEAQTRPLLAGYGMPVIPGALAHSADEAARVAEQIGFPVAMKIVSPDILHKSDVGGIKLGLQDAEAVRAAYHTMMHDLSTKLPQARLEGVLIEAMAPKGQEVIIGMRRDPNFGPLMMFGLGGIYVELFGDVSFRVAPLTRDDALEMIQQTRAGRLLTGFRGSAQADVDAVVDTLLRLSRLALDFPQIEEIEINPLLVLPKGALALDSRVVLKDETSGETG
jgi:acetyltransferase